MQQCSPQVATFEFLLRYRGMFGGCECSVTAESMCAMRMRIWSISRFEVRAHREHVALSQSSRGGACFTVCTLCLRVLHAAPLGRPLSCWPGPADTRLPRLLYKDTKDWAFSQEVRLL